VGCIQSDAAVEWRELEKANPKPARSHRSLPRSERVLIAEHSRADYIGRSAVAGHEETAAQGILRQAAVPLCADITL